VNVRGPLVKGGENRFEKEDNLNAEEKEKAENAKRGRIWEVPHGLVRWLGVGVQCSVKQRGGRGNHIEVLGE